MTDLCPQPWKLPAGGYWGAGGHGSGGIAVDGGGMRWGLAMRQPGESKREQLLWEKRKMGAVVCGTELGELSHLDYRRDSKREKG